MKISSIAAFLIFGAATSFAQAPTIGSCTVLPANNIWNTPIDTLPASPNSNTYVNAIGATTGAHPDFGSDPNGGIPFVQVLGTQIKYPVTFPDPSESDRGPYAVPLNAPIEGGSDRHAIAVDVNNCILYELFSASPQAAAWNADSGAIFDLKSNALRPATWTSADAAGLPIMPGLVRYDEVASGEIRHALRFTVPHTLRAYVWPARHYASTILDSQYPSMGQRFRLKANFDITPFPPDVQVILKALKKYGMMVADNGSAWYLTGQPDPRWNDDTLHTLGNVKGSAFEAVDVSSLMVDPNSGQAIQPGISVTVTPGGPTALLTGAVQQFTATVQGSTNQAVTWAVNGILGGSSSLGFVTSTGRYTAPPLAPSPSTVSVQAASVAFPAVSGTGMVTISNPPPPPPPPPPPSGTAAFVKTDTTTLGNWKGVYGADGYNVIGDTVAYPSYVTVTPSGNSGYTWANSTSDPRGLRKVNSTTDRIASAWYAFGVMNVDLNFKDTNTHQVALYTVDWDGYNGGRSQRVDILNGNNTQLDTRSLAGFGGGVYLVWNFTGHVVIRITSINTASNALLFGLLFGPGGANNPPPPANGTAAFVKTDSTTLGNWKGVYGADGYNVIGDTVAYPSYVTVTPSGNSGYTWANSTSDPRGLRKVNSTTDRIASAWYAFGVMNVDLNFTDANTHQVALYTVDWDGYNGGRSQRVDILDGNNTQLDTRSLANFGGGVYLVWNFTGHVVIRITSVNTASNALLFGLLFGPGGVNNPPPPASGTAAFVKTDTTTRGSWKGVYGADGYNVAGDASSYPAYVSVTPAAYNLYTWGTTTDVRGMQMVSSPTSRIASCLYTPGAMTIDLAFHDTAAHQVALYLVDWDGWGGGRSERIDIVDANGVQLDTRSIASFGAGQYMVWNFTGHVVIRITNLNPSSNATAHGFLFR